MLPIDNDIRKQILNQNGNIVISASAGTGKTHITVQRIKCDMDKNTGFKTFAAITFTRKAAKEISNRLGPNRGDGFVSTNDNFVWSEVIQPFMYDVFGYEFKKDISPDYSNENEVDTFDEGVEKIKEVGLMCKYRDNTKNFAFELGLKILKNSHTARRFINSKYYRMYIDEYQDSDVDMHKFFMYICDELCIPLFIVGDEKQSIYGWRGAYSRGFTSLFCKACFKKFDLKHNFRSNMAIQNFSNIFMDAVREYYQPIKLQDEVTLYRYVNIDDACNYIRKWIDTNNKCVILNYRRGVALEWSNKLKDIGLDFIYVPDSPIENSNMDSEHVWISRGIANFILKHRYTEYDFRDDIPAPENYKTAVLKSNLLKIDNNKDDFDNFRKYCYELYSLLGFEEKTDKIVAEIKVLHKVVIDEQFKPTYNQEKFRFTSGTIHSSKGLEFNQVIINASDYNLSRQDADHLHYVAITRPEERLLILGNEGYLFNRYLGYITDAVEETAKLGFDITIKDVVTIVK